MSEKIKGGLSDGKSLHDLVVHHGEESWASIQFESLEKKLQRELKKGLQVELEHTNDKKIAHEIAMDHLWEDPEYYTKLETIETKTLKESLMKRLLKLR